MQLSIFDELYEKYVVKKPIRIIEFFGGMGSQYNALKILGVDVEHYKLVEWAVNSIQAYNDIHHKDYNDHSKDMKKEELIDYLYQKGISINYNEPVTYEQLKRKNEKWLRTVYNNIIATNNLVNIQNVHGDDLEIIDKDKYEYIVTYSFPCQDLSLAGKREGMSKGDNTRSGMLWEVERILEELKAKKQMPQILLMENVPQVKQSANLDDFHKWQSKLESLGYKNYFKNLMATDYGMPQTRNRTFMISILGNYNCHFPEPIKLKYKLKDMLERNVDEKYYLSDKMINYCTDMTDRNGFVRGERFNPIDIDKQDTAYTVTTAAGSRPTDNFILTKDTENYIEWKEKGKLDIDCRAFKDDKVMSTIMTTNKNKVLVKEATKKGYTIATEGDSINLEQPNSTTRRGRVGKGVAQTLMTSPQQATLDNLRIRKLTPKECFRLMGFSNEDFDNASKNLSNSALYHIAGDSIVVTVLMAIFGELLGIDWQKKVEQHIEKLIEKGD